MSFSGRKELEERGEGDFPAMDYAGAELTEKAQAYADWLIEEKDIRPVVIDSRTIFYQFDEETTTWKEIDFEIIKKKANKDMGQDYTSHFLRQFKQSFRDHWRYTGFEEMGLGEEEVMLKDGNILDLETMDVREGSKEDMALNRINAAYNPDAEPERIEDFIERTIDTEEGVKALQEYLGYCLKWPSSKYEKVLLILGYTDTGKSTLLEIFEKFFEGSNTTKMSFPQIGMERAFHVEKLKDSVVNFDTDMDDEEIPRKSRLKKVISNEEIHADPKGEKGYDFQPKTKFMIASNNAPDDSGATDAYYNRFKTIKATNRVSENEKEIHADPKSEKGYDFQPKTKFMIASNNAPDDSGATDAYYNRFKTIKATNRVSENEKERNLVSKLTTEENLSWLLNWALEGLKRLEKNNMFSKQMTEYETKKSWTKFGTSTEKFISDQISFKTEESENIPTTDLYEVYEMWCEKKLETAVGQRKFISQAASHPDMRKEKAQSKDGSRRMCFTQIEVSDYAT